MQHISPEEQPGYLLFLDDKHNGVQIITCAFFQNGIGASRAVQQIFAELPSAQG